MTSPFVYVVGGKARDTKSPLQEWEWFEEARVLRVNTETGETETVIRYVSPPEHQPEVGGSVVFKAGHRVDRTLFLCTQTEILEYDLDGYELRNRISLPFFNDLHHVRLLSSGNLGVAVTGLDLVVELSPKGDVLREWATIDEQPFARFSREQDYRKIATTKPHLAHPNYLFELEGGLWATRFNQQDAIRLDDPNQRFSVADIAPHDGHVLEGSVYFTTVRGELVVLDAATRGRDKRRVYSIPSIANSGQRLGWCRGLALFDGARQAHIGFTRLRQTKIERNVAWVKEHLRGGALRRPERSFVSQGTMMVTVDLDQQRITGHVDLEPFGLNAIFSIHQDVPQPR